MQSEASPTERIDATDHMGLVHWVARRYTRLIEGTALSYEDLVHEGALGLMRAIEGFDPERSRFATFATWWIRAYISRAIHDKIRTVRHPAWTQDKRRHRARKKPRVVATERPPVHCAPITVDLPGGEQACLLDVLDIPEGRPPSPEENIALEQLSRRLGSAIMDLDYRERTVILGRFWHEQTLEEIGKKFGVSRERIRQVEARALAKLRVVAADAAQ